MIYFSGENENLLQRPLLLEIAGQQRRQELADVEKKRSVQILFSCDERVQSKPVLDAVVQIEPILDVQ